MSIQTEINRISGNVESAYSALESYGATMPEEQNSDNLARTVNTIAAVLYSEQTLNESQKAQARKNIGVGDSDISADKITAGTFAGMVKANAAAMANLAEPQVRNSVTVTNDPGEGAALSYPVGTEINVV